MTAGFLFFTFGLALVVSALKDQTIAEIFQGVVNTDQPLGRGKTYGSGNGTATGPQFDSGKIGGTGGELLQYLQDAAHKQFHLDITEPIGRDSGGHVANSLHKEGRAFDASGSSENMRAFTAWVAKNFGSEITELIHNPGGSIKNGKPVAPSFWRELWAKHRNHVHVGL